MNENLGFVLVMLIVFSGLAFNSYYNSLENREAIKAGLEQCIVNKETIWVKDCEKTLKIYKTKD